MKKIIIASIAIILCISGGLVFMGERFSKKECVNQINNQKGIVSNWKEISNDKKVTYAKCDGIVEFDSKKVADEMDYVFSGKVIDYKEYEIGWTDEKGEDWGPFTSTVIDVEVEDEYQGKKPVDGNVIRVYYPYSIKTIFPGSFVIKKNERYVFITKYLDKEFINTRNLEAPEDHFEQEKHADVYISNPCYDVMDVEKNIVILHNKYLNEENKQKVEESQIKDLDSSKISEKKLIKDGWFVAIEKENLKKSIRSFIKNNR